MTDLQVGLIIGGLVIIVAIYILNCWQAFRYKKTAAKAFAKNHSDVLLNTPKNMVRHGIDNQATARYEPSFIHENMYQSEENPPLSDEPIFESHYVADTESVIHTQETLLFEPTSVPASAEEPRSLPEEGEESSRAAEVLSANASSPDLYSPTRPRFRSSEADRDVSLHPTFYFIAEIQANIPIDAATMPILSAAKRVRCLGLRADKHWEVVTDGSLGQYYELKIGLQLVDRQGPIATEDINAFCQTIQIFADECAASVIFPQRLQKVQQAHELDLFCAETDVQIGLNLRAKTDLSLAKITEFAEQEKMTLAADGAFHLTDENGNTLLTLVNQNGHHFTPNLLGETRAISFILDLPRVAKGKQVFDHMCILAKQLAQILDADLVDDNEQPLTEQSLTIIRRELIHIQNKMQEHDIMPGSLIALQLYA